MHALTDTMQFSWLDNDVFLVRSEVLKVATIKAASRM